MTDAAEINHLWTHQTQNHPSLPDEELVIDHAESVFVWTERGHKLMDGFAGLAVVNVSPTRARRKMREPGIVDPPMTRLQRSRDRSKAHVDLVQSSRCIDSCRLGRCLCHGDSTHGQPTSLRKTALK
jgi:hypothetical protein